MWQEARKQEKKIRGLMVDYKKRAERRREFYEKIKLDPAQFVRVYGRPCKINLDPAVAYAAESPQSMMPWQGQTDNMIDRFDVRAHLDYMPQTKIVAPPTLSKREEEEERWCNYESYRIIVENECAGLTEEQALHQIYIDEQFGNVDKTKDEEKKKLEGKKAAIGFVYEDSTPVLKDEDESDDSDSGTDVEDADLDITLDVDTLNNEQKRLLNECAQQYGMKEEDFVSMLQKDKEEAEQVKLARILEEEKAQFAGRKSRRERRAYKEKRLAGRKLSPPSYAARDSPKYEPYERSSSSSKSRSRSPERKDSVLFITSFGGESDEDRPVVQGPSLPSTDKPDKWTKKQRKKNKRRKRSRSVSPSNKRRERDRLKTSFRKKRKSRSSSSDSSRSFRSSSRSRSSRSRSVSRSKSRSHSRSFSSTSRSSSISSKSRSISPQKNAPPIKRYRRASLSSKSSGSDSDHRPSGDRGYRDSRERYDRFDRHYGQRSETKSIGNKSSSAVPQAAKLTPQEKLKKRMQAALSKSFKADKKAEVERSIKSQQERLDREEELRIRALEMRRREREKRHRDDRSSSECSRSRSRSPESPRQRRRRSRSRSRERPRSSQMTRK